jgi:ATP-binding cassette subfamily B protein
MSRATPRLSPLRRLLPYARRHLGLATGWLLALACSSTATLTLPYAIRQMIDLGFSSEHAGTIDRYFLGLIGVAAVLALATALRYFFISVFGERVVAAVRRDLYAQLLRLDQRFFDQSRSGELLSRLTTDLELIHTLIGSSVSVALRSVVMVLGAGTLMFLTSPGLAAGIVFGIPLTVLPMWMFGRRVRNLSRQSQDRVADTAALASEVLGAMRTVQAAAQEPFEQQRFDRVVDATLVAHLRRIRMRAWLTGFVILLVFGAIAGVLWLGARSVVGGELSAGTLGQFVLYAVIAASSVGALTEVWGEVQRATGAAERVGELLDEVPGIVAQAPVQTLPTPLAGRIAFENVGFRYPSRPDQAALEDFSLTVEPGERVALVGPSGAGKTTVLQLLLRFYDPQSGRVTLDGVDLRHLSPPELRARLAQVPQDPVIFAASAADNIRYGRPDASQAEVEAAAEAAEALGFIRELPQGLDSELGERGVRLSGGQKQRIAIARALIRNAPVLLLDEATSALDAHSERLVQTALDRLMQGRTTLVIAHRLATVLSCHRIVVLDAGRIVDIGSHAELVQRCELYARLARLQFETHQVQPAT